MELIFGTLISFFTLLISVLQGIFIGYPLLISLFIFIIIFWRKNYSLLSIMKMILDGVKNALVVLIIFVLIGAITATWMASGTVPAIVFYGIQLMNPEMFVLFSFLICSLVSFLLGTSFGTVGTVGMALIFMAKSGEVNINAAAGAIIAGAYFGDRCSPMSSGAILIANITKTDIYVNIRNMFKTGALPFGLSVIIYGFISILEPLNIEGSNIDVNIINTFEINWIALIPAIIILVLALFKIDIKYSMVVSILSAMGIAYFLQKYSIKEIINFIIWGFQLNKENNLSDILKGGGLISMFKAIFVVFVACSLAGVFEGTEAFKNLEQKIKKANSRFEIFLNTTIFGIVSGVVGCSQTVSLVLTNQVMKGVYEKKNLDENQLALDIENTGVVISPLIPWNLAAIVPTTTLMVSISGFVPYAFYLYLIPITNLLYLKLQENSNLKWLKADNQKNY